jgi:hypothetical protein
MQAQAGDKDSPEDSLLEGEMLEKSNATFLDQNRAATPTLPKWAVYNPDLYSHFSLGSEMLLLLLLDARTDAGEVPGDGVPEGDVVEK